MAKKSSRSGSKKSSSKKSSSQKSSSQKSSAKKSSAKHSGAKKSSRRGSGRRELIDTGTDKRFVRRSAGGQFKESDDVSRSLSADRRRKAKTVSKSGQGDRGDRKR